eukprot:m.170871 g.170871  ORF g.170871 m.170871 type:complete len:171 (-) comp14536_c0_seq18:2801-3313(-)
MLNVYELYIAEKICFIYTHIDESSPERNAFPIVSRRHKQTCSIVLWYQPSTDVTSVFVLCLHLSCERTVAGKNLQTISAAQEFCSWFLGQNNSDYLIQARQALHHGTDEGNPSDFGCSACVLVPRHCWCTNGLSNQLSPFNHHATYISYNAHTHNKQPLQLYNRTCEPGK